MPELKEQLPKITLATPFVGKVGFSLVHLHRPRQLSSARRESILRKKPNEHVKIKTPDGLVHRGSASSGNQAISRSNSRHGSASLEPDTIFSERRLSVVVELADTLNPDLFVVEIYDAELSSNKGLLKTDLEASRNARKTVYDVTGPRGTGVDLNPGQLGPSDQKRSLLASTFFSSEAPDRPQENTKKGLASFRQNLMKKHRRNFCFPLFIIASFLVVASIGVIIYLYIIIAQMYSDMESSASIIHDFSHVSLSARNIIQASDRIVSAYRENPVDFEGFYFNQLIVS
jgi:hypothetical protein